MICTHPFSPHFLSLTMTEAENRQHAPERRCYTAVHICSLGSLVRCALENGAEILLGSVLTVWYARSLCRTLYKKSRPVWPFIPARDIRRKIDYQIPCESPSASITADRFALHHANDHQSVLRIRRRVFASDTDHTKEPRCTS